MGEELARAAGFFNGEGSTSLSRVSGRVYLVLSVANTCYDNLYQFQMAIGGIGIISKERWKRGATKPIKEFRINRSIQVHQTMKLLWPWLSREKKDQYLYCLDEFKRDRKNMTNKKAVHGTLSYYTYYKCRCNLCFEARRRYDANRREKLLGLR